MKKRFQLSPVLVELAIVTFFLALSTATVVQLIAKAAEISRAATNESAALIALENAVEEIKADPAAGAYDAGGVWKVSMESEGAVITGTVTRTRSAAGAYYDIDLTAEKGSSALSIAAGRYVGSGEAGA